MGTRLATAAGLATLCVLLHLGIGNASAPTASPTPGTAEITLFGTASDGTHVSVTSHISDIALSDQSPTFPAETAPRGTSYLSFFAQTDQSNDTHPTFDAIESGPTPEVHLVLSDGKAVPGQQPAQIGNMLEGTYFFLVPASTTTARLVATPGTAGAAEYSGADGQGSVTFTQITFEPATTTLVVPPPGLSPTTTTAPSTTLQKRAGSPPRTRAQNHHSSSAIAFVSPLGIGSASGAGAVVVVLLIPLWRRRSYRRAEAQGRVLIDSPPVLLSPRVAPLISGLVRTQTAGPGAELTEAVIVRVLGPIEIDGLRKPIDKSPVRELLVFLALHPGRRFSSTELRASIWVEGRAEPAASTFHNYLSDLRRSLPANSLVKDGYRFSLTDSVSSDWGLFLALIQGDDARADRLADALGLVRGIPFEGASEGRNAPFAWTGEFSYRIEATIERTAHELASVGLESGDLVPADTALSKALKAVPSSIVVRQDHLRLGAALAGRREVRRRMQTAQAAMGDDLGTLEALASELGWTSK